MPLAIPILTILAAFKIGTALIMFTDGAIVKKKIMYPKKSVNLGTARQCRAGVPQS
jgi:hypothetical protein